MSTVFQVGDRVRVSLVSGKADGVIVEDRGNLGYRGRHVYRVMVPMDPFEPTEYELSEHEIEAAPSSN
jgi:hypothetical protein